MMGEWVGNDVKGSGAPPNEVLSRYVYGGNEVKREGF
jgi:hypothetical protein